jgi:hypothetical protein
MYSYIPLPIYLPNHRIPPKINDRKVSHASFALRAYNIHTTQSVPPYILPQKVTNGFRFRGLTYLPADGDNKYL